MILDKQECKLYYDLMWSLQYYINQKLNIIPAIKSLDDYIALDRNEKLLVRNALYEHINLIDEYVKENPQKFSADELAQAMAWKKFVKGYFYIERYLKKHAIFIGPEDKVYAVHGLQQPLDEIIHKSYLPHAVEAVLLPFADKIIYDGLLLNYSVHFGGGISSDLKETYLKAKSKGDIIESLTAQQKKQSTPTLLKNWQNEMHDLSAIAQSLRGGQGQPAHYSPVFSLIKASIELGELATTMPPDTDALWKAFDRASRSLDNIEKALHRME